MQKELMTGNSEAIVQVIVKCRGNTTTAEKGMLVSTCLPF